MSDTSWILEQLQKIRTAIDYIAVIPPVEPISFSRKGTFFDKMSLSEKAIFFDKLSEMDRIVDIIADMTKRISQEKVSGQPEQK